MPARSASPACASTWKMAPSPSPTARYSFYGLRPVTRVLKLDLTTLPPGAVLGSAGHRNSVDEQASPAVRTRQASTRFVDLKKGELHKANFVEQSCAPSVRRDVMARRQAASAQRDETAASVRRDFKRKPRLSKPPTCAAARRPATWTRSAARPASTSRRHATKIVGDARDADRWRERRQRAGSGPGPAHGGAAARSRPGTGPAEPEGRPDPAHRPDRHHGQGRLGAVFRVMVNGAEVGQDRVGKKASCKTRACKAGNTWREPAPRRQPHPGRTARRHGQRARAHPSA